MKNNLLILLVLGFIALLLIGLPSLLMQGIKKAKDCDQFVIDSYEVLTGIDIPKQTGSQCFYKEDERLRLGVYRVRTPQDFIASHPFQALDTDLTKPLWSHDFLGDGQAPLPKVENALYQVQGEKAGNTWQCIVEKHTGNMWFEVKWKE